SLATLHLKEQQSHYNSILNRISLPPTFVFFFLNDTAPTALYTLSLHDALPISLERVGRRHVRTVGARRGNFRAARQREGEQGDERDCACHRYLLIIELSRGASIGLSSI